MDSAEAHRELTAVTGAGSPITVRAVAGVNAIATAFGTATTALESFAAHVRELLDSLDGLVDDQGREVWMRTGEVELDLWADRVIKARDAVRRDLA